MPAERFLRDIEVAERYALGRYTVWRLAREGRLPKPVKLAPNTTRWRLSDLETFEAKLGKNAA